MDAFLYSVRIAAHLGGSPESRERTFAPCAQGTKPQLGFVSDLQI